MGWEVCLAAEVEPEDGFFAGFLPVIFLCLLDSKGLGAGDFDLVLLVTELPEGANLPDLSRTS